MQEQAMTKYIVCYSCCCDSTCIRIAPALKELQGHCSRLRGIEAQHWSDCTAALHYKAPSCCKSHMAQLLCVVEQQASAAPATGWCCPQAKQLLYNINEKTHLQAGMFRLSLQTPSPRPPLPASAGQTSAATTPSTND
jgi:hypothetical protein